MLKRLARNVWVYDVEWAPDPAVGRQVYGLPADMPDRDVIEEMFRRGGATPDNPRPFLKTTLCRIVSTAVFARRSDSEGAVRFTLRSLPAIGGPPIPEREILNQFLAGIGKQHPQLVGFNCIEADLPIILQRAVAHQLHQPEFSKRPNKPWEGIDYFMKHSEWHVDLKDMLGGFGKATPSLHELCVACGIPGKFYSHGADVLDLWLAGDVDTIARYDQCDVLSSYELFMRVALLAGFVTPEAFEAERMLFTEYLTALAGDEKDSHLLRYLEESRRLRQALTPTEVERQPQLVLAS